MDLVSFYAAMAFVVMVILAIVNSKLKVESARPLEVPSALGPMGEDLGGPYAPWSNATAVHASFDAEPGGSPAGRVANADADARSPAPSEWIAARGFGD